MKTTEGFEACFAHSKYGSLQYYYSQDGPIDPFMPANSWYYELDASDFDNFDILQFQIFLGALFADGQTFIIRSFDESGNFADRNDIVFGFNAFQREIFPENIVAPLGNTYKFVFPVNSGTELFTSDEAYYNELQARWQVILSKLNSNTRCHKPRYVTSWIKLCDQVCIDKNFF